MRVKIYKPSKTAMQSGFAKTEQWILEYIPETRRGPESLMGWTASGDTLNQVKLKFDSKDQAIAFAESKGWQYLISKPKTRIVRPRNYGDNFKYFPPDEAQN